MSQNQTKDFANEEEPKVVDFSESEEELNPIGFIKENGIVKATGSLNATARSVLGIGGIHTGDQDALKDIVHLIVKDVRREAYAYEFTAVAVLIRHLVEEVKHMLTASDNYDLSDTVVVGKTKDKETGDDKDVEATRRAVLEAFYARAKSLLDSAVRMADIFSFKVNLDKPVIDARFDALIKFFGGKH